jgi:hypothetical protein
VGTGFDCAETRSACQGSAGHARILLALAVPGLSYTSAVAGPTVASLVAKPRACRYSPCVLELLRIFSKDVDEHDTATQLNLRQNYVAILSERSPSALKLYTSRFGRDACHTARSAALFPYAVLCDQPPLSFAPPSHDDPQDGARMHLV